MLKKPKILVVGSLVMDLIVSSERFPNSGETVIGCGFQQAAGGKGANQAVQAARLGASVTMVGKVGNDSFGKELLASAAASGVDVSKVAVATDAPSAIGNVQLEVSGKKTANRIVVVPGANMKITKEDIAFLKEDIVNYDMVILQLEIPMEINEIVAKYAYDKGVAVMLNSAPSAPLSKDILKCLTYISPNEHEAFDITSVKITDEDSTKKAVSALMDLGVKNALITLGSKGAALGNKNEFMISPCIDCVEVKDPTAAGDSFVGAFSTAVCMGLAHDKALLFANYTATLTVSRMGAQPSLPTIKEVVDLMKSQNCDTAPYEVLL